MTRIEIDGRAATAETLAHPAVSTHGHFTAMQVRDHKVRGLDLHLARLRAGSREVFDSALDEELLLRHLRHALTGVVDASLRVYVFQPEDELSFMVTVMPPGEPPATPQRLRAVPYARPFAQVKHLGGFAQAHYTRLVRREGFDDALMVTQDGFVTEGATTNIGFFDDDTVVWPDAPVLLGITMQLLNFALTEREVVSRLAEVRLDEVASFDGAFLTNARGIVPVASIDDVVFPVDADRMKVVTEAYDSAPWREV
ncbi:aminotransferase class IV [Umezawaea tangerina]|uniref:Branched-subunit amino acid aminotransferase/4-amino-4-deoxychorismate lyase n=1 Tax=Umezawaea tangerina TaxID=84725 RepID=A0A2T0SLE1_9PSEU|nr:aminotransferase class IV [Umezawaea tangerina]PRY34231.1 branched-subunit amino acid aminotransferase/4-amino-4-deoxychorismate lyase [Umezawaea tangerina]